MPTDVDFVHAAIDDLADLDRGVMLRILKKITDLERSGPQLGRPLGHRAGVNLTGFRKLVVGNRQWRIVYEETGPDAVLIWVAGPRSDAECYQEARDRVERLGPSPPRVALERALNQLAEMTGRQIRASERAAERSPRRWGRRQR